MAVADALSRSPLKHRQTDKGATAEKDIELHVDSVRLQWSASDNKLRQIASETGKDEKLQAAIQMVTEGWPSEKSKVPEHLLDLYQMRGELSTSQGLLLRGSRIVVPQSMRKEILEKIHDGHQGIAKCRE